MPHLTPGSASRARGRQRLHRALLLAARLASVALATGIAVTTGGGFPR